MIISCCNCQEQEISRLETASGVRDIVLLRPVKSLSSESDAKTAWKAVF